MRLGLDPSEDVDTHVDMSGHAFPLTSPHACIYSDMPTTHTAWPTRGTSR